MSNRDILLLTLSLNQKKKCWVHDINVRRQRFGEFNHLFDDLEKDEVKFRQYFRLPISEFYEILGLIKKDIQKKDTNFRKAIPVKERLAVCLRFLATGDTFQTIGFSYRMGARTVASIVEEVCKALWVHLMPIVMPEPTTEMWLKSEQGFRERWDFPHCIGAIDGKHVLIRKPGGTGSMYYNYKKTCSIVLLAIVDADYKFIAVDVGLCGKNSDGGVLENSNLGKRLKNRTLGVPAEQILSEHSLPFVIVGDEAFPLETYLLRPYARDRLTISRRVFNYRLSRARRVSENAFGILVQQWRIFQRPLNCKLELVDKIVKACLVLHNYLRKDINGTSNGMENVADVTDLALAELPRLSKRRYNLLTRQTRDYFKDYFISPEGSVPWQLDIVNRQ